MYFVTKIILLSSICGCVLATCQVGPSNKIINCQNTSIENYTYDILELYTDYTRTDLEQLNILNSNFPVIEDLINPFLYAGPTPRNNFGLKISLSGIERIEDHAFDSFSFMSTLDLSFNEIADLNFGSTLSSSLNNLILKNNKITHLNYSTLPSNLFRLDLSFNFLTELDLTPRKYNFPVYSMIDVSYNRITVVDLLPREGNNPSVAFYVTNNPLQEIKNCRSTNGTQGSSRSFGLINLSNSLNSVSVESFMGCDIKFNSLISSGTQINITDSFNLTGLQRLEFSNSSITHIPRQIFESQHLTSLNLSYNDLINLNEPVFNGTVISDTLDLVCSNIVNVENIFQGLDANTLNLSGNNIIDLNSMSFSKIQGCKNLDLSFNNLTLKKDSFINARNYLTILNLTNSNISIIDVEAFNGLKYLKSLHLENNALKTLTPNVFKPLTGIKEIYLQNNQLAVLQQGLFNGLYVRVINLNGNSLERIETNAFYDLNYDILNIEINNNRAPLVIEESAFSQMSYLQSINICNSRLTTIKADMFFNTPSLKIMDVSGNNVTTIDFSKYKRLDSLEQLNITVNIDLEPQSFLGLSNLQVLTFHNSQLSTLKRNTFQGLFSLKLLELNKSSIDSLEDGALDSLFKLQKLHIDNVFNKKGLNSLAFKDLHELTDFDLSFQFLQDIETKAFRYLQTLKYLNMSYNSLITIKTHYFEYLDSLKVLDLSNNDIESIELGAFEHFFNLETLILSNNKLGDLKIGTFSNLNSLVSLDLSRNNISRMLSTEYIPLRSLTQLDLEYNQLSYLGNYSILDRKEIPRSIKIGANKWSCDYLETVLATSNSKLNFTASNKNFQVQNIEGIECF